MRKANLLDQRLGRGDRGIAGWHAHLERIVQELVKEGLDVRLDLAPRDLVALGDIGRDRPAELGRRRSVAVALGHLAVEVERLLRRLHRAEGLQIGVFALGGGTPFDRLGAALRRDPDRRMRLLQRPRPEVDVVELVMPAVVAERPDLGPRAQNELVRLVITPVRMGGVDAAGEILGADAAHKAGDDAAAEMIEHGELFRYRHRIAHQRQRTPEDRDLRLLGRARARPRSGWAPASARRRSDGARSRRCRRSRAGRRARARRYSGRRAFRRPRDRKELGSVTQAEL